MPSTLNFQPSTAFAQGTAFSYQGRLDDGGSPANGSYDLRFSLFTTNTGGSLAYGYLTNSATAISNGLFTVTLDFGNNVFDGTTYWLQIGVRTNGGSAFTALSPRQELTPAPYSIFAEGASAAGLSGTVPMSSLSGTYGGAVNFTNPASSFTGSGAGLSGVNAGTLGGLAPGSFWQLGGNSTVGGQFLGTVNNQPLDFYADNVRALRLILRTDATGVFSNAPNVIGGSSVNLVMTGVVGGTVAGGGGNGTNGLTYPNQVNADFAAIGGGLGNMVNGIGSFIGGGGYDGSFFLGNSIKDNAAVIGGGLGNSIPSGGLYSVIGGGHGNTASGIAAVVGGGQVNLVNAQDAMVGAGVSNSISGTGSFIGGGGFDGTMIAGNSIQGSAAVIGGGLGNSSPSGGTYSFIGGGYFNTASGYGAIVGGGGYNTASTNLSTVAGGYVNTASGSDSTVSGGFDNIASGYLAAIGGGTRHSAQGDYSMVGGGYENTAGGIGSFIGGGGYDGTTFAGNFVNANAATIGGGLSNTIPAGSRYAFIGGGVSNTASAYYASVGGGYGNTSSGTGAFVGGGGNDGIAFEFESGNSASGGGAVVAGGVGNVASGTDSAVGGGYQNTASGLDATLPGGDGNTASGRTSFAAGNLAKATHDGSFVWADDNGFNFSSTAANVFFARCTGGVKFVTAIDGTTGADTAGVKVDAGATSWTTVCDRNAKKNFQPVDTVAVLNKLSAIPIEQWNYKWEADTNTPNLGPMAQDFKAAFYPGRDDTCISTLEFDGVELAAIQGLNQRMDELKTALNRRAAENAELKQENQRLETRLEVLETVIFKQKSN